MQNSIIWQRKCTTPCVWSKAGDGPNKIDDTDISFRTFAKCWSMFTRNDCSLQYSKSTIGLHFKKTFFTVRILYRKTYSKFRLPISYLKSYSKFQIVQLASYLRYHLEGVRLVYLISYSRFRSRLYFSENLEYKAAYNAQPPKSTIGLHFKKTFFTVRILYRKTYSKFSTWGVRLVYVISYSRFRSRLYFSEI